MDGAVRAGVGLLIVFQCPERLRRIEGDPPLTIHQSPPFLEKTGHELAGADRHVADGHRSAVLHRRGGILAAGEKGRRSVVRLKAPGDFQFPAVGLKEHPLVGGVVKKIPAVKQQLGAGVVWHAVPDATDGGVLAPQLRDRTFQQPVQVEGQLREGTKQPFRQLIHPGNVHADYIIPVHVGGLDQVIHVPQRGQHRQVHMDAGALFQIRQQPFQCVGRGGGHGQHPQVRLRQAGRRGRAAEAAVFHQEPLRHGRGAFQMCREPLDELMGQPFVVQLVDRNGGVRHRGADRHRQQRRQCLPAGIGRGGANRRLPDLIRADDGVIGLPLLKKLKSPEGHLIVGTVHHRGLVAADRLKAPQKQRRVRRGGRLGEDAHPMQTLLPEVPCHLRAHALRVKGGVHHVGQGGALPLQQHQRKIRLLAAVIRDGVRQTGAGDDRADPVSQSNGEQFLFRRLHGAGGIQPHRIAPLGKFALKHLIHGGVPRVLDPRQQHRDGAVAPQT